MRIPDMSTCKSGIALLAVVMLHLVMLARLWCSPQADSVHVRSQDARITVTLMRPESSAAVPPATPAIQRRAVPRLLPASRTAISLQDEAAKPPSKRPESVEKKPHEQQGLSRDSEKIAEFAESSKNEPLPQQPMNLKANAGAIDRQWLPRDTGSLQSGTVRPALRARTSQEVFERKLSQAARDDCRTKHAAMGLLAIPFLAADTVSDTGCKW